MEWQCYQIAGSSFHFGRQGLGGEVCSVSLPSDSLFAAMTANAAALMDDAEFSEWIAPFQKGEPSFFLTSAFPMAGELRFFPKPLASRRTSAPVDSSFLKKLKKISYLSEKLFFRMLAGESLDALLKDAEIFQGGSALVSKDELNLLPEAVRKEKRIWSAEKRPRVTLDRETNASMIFFTGYTQFSEGCGLWFALRGNTPDVSGTLTRIFEDLSVSGLGGNRGIGFGSCAISPVGALDLPEAEKGPWVTLSRYIPASDEMAALADEKASYSIESVGGWLNSAGIKAERRKIVPMIAEGSVLGPCAKQAPGTLADVQPVYKGTAPVGHPVFRSGFAAPVGISFREEA